MNTESLTPDLQEMIQAEKELNNLSIPQACFIAAFKAFCRDHPERVIVARSLVSERTEITACAQKILSYHLLVYSMVSDYTMKKIEIDVETGAIVDLLDYEIARMLNMEGIIEKLFDSRIEEIVLDYLEKTENEEIA